MNRRDAADATIRGAMKALFGRAAGQCHAEDMQQWLYDHEKELPDGIREILFAAQQACNAYELFQGQANCEYGPEHDSNP